MSSEWHSLPASEFCESVRDGTHDSPKEVPSGGRNLVTSRHIKGGVLDLEKSYKISVDDFNEINRRSKVDQWDILFSMIGTVGETLLVKDRNPNFAIKNVGLFKNKNELSGRWLYYFLNSPDTKTEIESLSRGTTQQYVPLGALRSLQIRFPSSNHCQQKIVDILSTLDDKIELNRKTNETLEGIAKALFKSWFVDFDPVRAKAEGRPTGLPDEISELFPDSFEDSELGEIPSGWSVCSIGELVTLEHDSITPGESPEEIFDHYSIPAFDEGMVPAAESGESIKSNKYLISDGVFMISKLNPRSPRIWIPASAGKRRKICSTEFLVCRPKAPIGIPFAYHLSKSGSITQRMSDMASGTSNSHQRVRPVDFTSLTTVRPADHLLDLFTNQISPLLRRSLVIREENQILAQCRDALLPKLISGELRVPDAERMLEEVGI